MEEYESTDHKLARLEAENADLRASCGQYAERLDMKNGTCLILQREIAKRNALISAYESMQFPAALRKVWTGEEVNGWLEGEHERIRAGYRLETAADG